jgi:hypothetical protein
MSLPLCVVSQPEELQQGLFGQIFYYVFQILPYLERQRIYPRWEIRSMHYGDGPESLTVPGVLDLAYEAPEGPWRRMRLDELRRRHAHVLGNDWAELHRIWSSYFRIPPRILELSRAHLPQGRVLGVHYRGTDKQHSAWDSNPITQDEYMVLVKDFLGQRSEFDAVFAASDEPLFVEKLRASTELPVLTLGEVDFHLSAEPRVSRRERADRALLDCVLLSRCGCVLETSSALPSFAKLLNPDLEIYRCAASKLFGKLFSNMPYFPVAHVPVLPVRSAAAEEILRGTMESDWRKQPGMGRFQSTFSFAPQWPRNHRLFSLTDQMGVSSVAARLVRGYR